MVCQARSNVIPCRSTVRSGSTEPDRSRLSQLPSRVADACGRGVDFSIAVGRKGGIRFAVAEAEIALSAGASRSGASRDSGLMLAVTRAHSDASSGLSERTGSDALGQQDECLA